MAGVAPLAPPRSPVPIPPKSRGADTEVGLLVHGVVAGSCAAARASGQLVRFHDPISHPSLTAGGVVIWLQPVLYVPTAWCTRLGSRRREICDSPVTLQQLTSLKQRRESYKGRVAVLCLFHYYYCCCLLALLSLVTGVEK